MDTIIWPPKFTLDQQAILHLFTGETFYSNVDVAIREAVLNAIDAIGRRHIAEPNILPDIRVVFDRQSMTVTVSDNGDGMEQEQFSHLFTTIGRSAARIATNIQAEQYNAVGEFGIGVLSYFLICERFQIHSKTATGDSIGLEFTRTMLDAETQARLVDASREERGTTLVLSIEKERFLDRLLARFSYWMRDVDGLEATKYPEGESIPQGGLTKPILKVEVDKPPWIHEAHIGPPRLFSAWDSFDGSAHVDILYRGVFVDEISIDHLWAISGSINVDPKHFRPKLNREGFVGDELHSELEPFLRKWHPAVLERAIDCVREVLTEEDTKQWSLHRWVTLWLAVPRSGQYEKASQLWDEEFRTRKAFKLLAGGGRESDVSISDILELGTTDVYVVAENLGSTNLITQQAVRILRDSKRPVIQGVTREQHFLTNTSLIGASTGDLLVGHFRHLLPTLIQVEQVADSIIKQETAVQVFDDPPTISLVNIGADSVPVIPVGQEIWINIDSGSGREILEELCSRNDGHLGFWMACLKHGGLQENRNYARDVARILSTCPEDASRLGPVKRQFLRGLIR